MIKFTIALLNDRPEVKKRRSLRIFDNLMITKVSISYGTDSQIGQNRVLTGWDHSGIQVDFYDSEYMEGIKMGVGKGLESGWIFVTTPRSEYPGKSTDYRLKRCLDQENGKKLKCRGRSYRPINFLPFI